MRTFVRWLIIVLLLLMTAFLLLVGPRSRAHPAPLAITASSSSITATPFALQQTIVSPTPGTAIPIIPQTGSTPVSPSTVSSIVQIRDQVCVRRVPYTILSLPSAATFEIIPAPGQDPTQMSCNSVLSISDTRTVVCTNRQASALTLRVTENGLIEDVLIPFRSCLASGQPEPEPGPISQPTDAISTPSVESTATSPAPTEPPPPTETLPAPTP